MSYLSLPDIFSGLITAVLIVAISAPITWLIARNRRKKLFYIPLISFLLAVIVLVFDYFLSNSTDLDDVVLGVLLLLFSFGSFISSLYFHFRWKNQKEKEE
ncbi:MAG: hypothetical protein WC225_02630 [Acholeplasmataceae bacterium]